MPVDDAYRKSVCYLVVPFPDMASGVRRLQPVGTAFLIAVPAARDVLDLLDPETETSGPLRYFFATARHLIDLGRREDQLLLRVNALGHGLHDIEAPADIWTSHPTADVSVLEVDATDRLDVRAIPTWMFADDRYCASQDLLGEPVFCVGLFSRHAGSATNQPILRFGHISMLRHEPVTFRPLPDTTLEMEAFLIETHSWGGHSGAPVVVQHPFIINPGPFQAIRVARPTAALLGLVAGHYELERQLADEFGRTTVPENAGIAVVTPAQRILEALAEAINCSADVLTLSPLADGDATPEDRQQ